MVTRFNIMFEWEKFEKNLAKIASKNIFPENICNEHTIIVLLCMNSKGVITNDS